MNFEYETQGTARFLVYRKQNEEVIDSISMGMISNNKIEGIIPFAYVQMDDVVCFKYNVSAYNTLQQYFSGVVGKKQFLTVLNSIMKVFVQSEDYMLEASSFILDVSYIFVNPVSSETKLIVLPVVREESISVEKFVRNLVFGTQFDQTEDCSYIAAIISFLNANKFFSARDFSNLTEKLLKDANGFSGQTVVPAMKRVIPEQKPVSVPTPKVIPASVPTPTPVPIPVPKLKAMNEVEKNAMAIPGAKTFETVEKKITGIPKPVMPGAKEKKTPAKKKSIFGRGEKKPKEKATGIFPGMAVPGMEVPTSMKQSRMMQDKTPVEHSEIQKTHVSVPEQNIPVQMHNVKPQYFGETVDLRSYVQQTGSAGETTVLNMTVQEQSYFLNIRTKERYVIVKEVSTIGKDCAINDFCVRENGAVSRTHATIYMQNGQVYIEDNGSTNGTYVNGMKLVPKIKSKALEHGMRIRLGNEELEFKTHE